MRSKATLDTIISSGDLVQVLVQNGHENRSKWLSPRVVQESDRSYGTVTIPALNGHKIIAVLEDTRVVIVDDELTCILAFHIME